MKRLYGAITLVDLLSVNTLAYACPNGGINTHITNNAGAMM